MEEVQFTIPPAVEERQKSRSRGAGFWIALVGAIFFFACMGMIIIVLVLVSATKSVLPDIEPIDPMAGRYTESCVEGSGTYKIVAIPLDGIISSQSVSHYFYQSPSVVRSVTDQLEQAAEDSKVKAIILEIDSPGGGITATDILYKELLDFKDSGKKVIVHMKDVAASGGYYVAACADKIVAHPTTITGSIGVIMMLLNFEDMYKWIGISDKTIKSGKFKDIGSASRAMTEEEEQLFKDIIMEMHSRFVDIIAKGRSMSRDNVMVLADGRMYTGEQAVKNGLIDSLGYFDDAVAVAKEAAGISEARIVRYRRQVGWSEILLSKARTGKGVEALIDTESLFRKQSPSFMYLWAPGFGKE